MSNLLQRKASSMIQVIIEQEKRGVKTPDYDKNDSTGKAAYRIFEQYMFEKAEAENGRIRPQPDRIMR
jgi:hypothetical protein